MNGVISRIEEDAIIYIWAAEFPTSELLFLNNTNDATFRVAKFFPYDYFATNYYSYYPSILARRFREFPIVWRQ